MSGTPDSAHASDLIKSFQSADLSSHKGRISDTTDKILNGRTEGLAKKCSGARLAELTLDALPERCVHAAGAAAARALNVDLAAVHRPNNIGSGRAFHFRARHGAAFAR